MHRAARVTEQIEFAEPIRALAWTPNGKTLFMGDDKAQGGGDMENRVEVEGRVRVKTFRRYVQRTGCLA